MTNIEMTWTAGAYRGAYEFDRNGETIRRELTRFDDGRELVMDYVVNHVDDNGTVSDLCRHTGYNSFPPADAKAMTFVPKR